MEYSPSLATVMFIFDSFTDAPPTKVPRKVFRIITDTWLASYTESLPNRGTKTFDSLDEARWDFYKEFTQDSGTFFVNLLSYGAMPYVQHPLGLVSALELACFPVFQLIFHLREDQPPGKNGSHLPSTPPYFIAFGLWRIMTWAFNGWSDTSSCPN